MIVFYFGLIQPKKEIILSTMIKEVMDVDTIEWKKKDTFLNKIGVFQRKGRFMNE